MEFSKQTRRVIVRLLSNLGSPKEVQQYLKRYSDIERFHFAVVKVGGAILDSHLQELATALTFLQQVGLTPIVIHGGGPQLSRALSRDGIDSETRDGLRVTSAATLKVARQVFQGLNRDLVAALREAGAEATSLTGDVFEARILDRERYGLVGEVTHVELDAVRPVIEAGQIAVISPLAASADGQILNINGDVAANALIRAVQPFKIVFLSGTGGILDAQDELISSINLSTDYARLMQEDWLHSGMRLKLEQIHDVLADLPLESSVSITRPAHLAKELFTHRGSGTLVRRGEAIHHYTRWQDLDTERLQALLESSFGKRLADDYFEHTPLLAAYVSDSYRAAALITRSDDTRVARLDKFAVTEQAQGEGLGRALWERVRDQHAQLYWRARPGNPVNIFYAAQADGFVRRGGWLVYWYGLASLAEVEPLIVLGADSRATMLDEADA